MLVNRERSGKLLDMTSGTPFETVTLTTLYRDRKLFNDLLSEAKVWRWLVKVKQLSLHLGGRNGDLWTASVQKIVGSVILDEGIAENIVNDVKDFLTSGEVVSQAWYTLQKRLFVIWSTWGGKTSFIQALAGGWITIFVF